MKLLNIPVCVSRANLDRLHTLRDAAGLERVSDSVLVQIVFCAGLQAERDDLRQLAEAEAA